MGLITSILFLFGSV